MHGEIHDRVPVVKLIVDVNKGRYTYIMCFSQLKEHAVTLVPYQQAIYSSISDLLRAEITIDPNISD